MFNKVMLVVDKNTWGLDFMLDVMGCPEIEAEFYILIKSSI